MSRHELGSVFLHIFCLLGNIERGFAGRACSGRKLGGVRFVLLFALEVRPIVDRRYPDPRVLQLVGVFDKEFVLMDQALVVLPLQLAFVVLRIGVLEENRVVGVFLPELSQLDQELVVGRVADQTL